MPNRFIGVKLAYNIVTQYFDPATGNTKNGFDHFAFVPEIPTITLNDNKYSLQVFAVAGDGKTLNNKAPLPSSPDEGHGHTKVANPRVNFSIIRIFFEQLRDLYPPGSPGTSELTLFPHHFSGTTNHMVYKVETNNKDLVSKDLNPSPPSNLSRSFEVNLEEVLSN